MHPHRLGQLVDSVPADIDADRRAALLAHVQTADGCRLRIERVRAELGAALRGGAGQERALDLACELDGLERVQQRVDGWLITLVDDLTRPTIRQPHYGDGVPA